MEIKKEFMKDPSEIEESITRHSSLPNGSKDLVSIDTYTGGLTPLLDNYLPEGLDLSDDEKKAVSHGMRNLSTGLRSSMPITCYGEKCPFRLQCPLHQLGKAPEGKACPVEAMLLDLYTKRYLDEFNVDSDLMSEVTTMTMLASTHILEMRAFILLGKSDDENPDGLIKNVVGFNSDDEPIVQLQEHPAYNQIERAWRWRRNLLESLVGTRKEKYKRQAAMGDIRTESVSSSAADLKSTIEKITVVDISGE